MEPEGEWSALVESLVEALVPALRRRLYAHHFARIRELTAYSD